MKIREMLETEIEPGFCFRVSAGFAEAEKESDLERILASAESMQNVVYDFRVC
jgi:phospholipid/cholesterol/gamma-HCH transport system ATP-binding protein